MQQTRLKRRTMPCYAMNNSYFRFVGLNARPLMRTALLCASQGLYKCCCAGCLMPPTLYVPPTPKAKLYYRRGSTGMDVAVVVDAAGRDADVEGASRPSCYRVKAGLPPWASPGRRDVVLDVEPAHPFCGALGHPLADTRHTGL